MNHSRRFLEGFLAVTLPLGIVILILFVWLWKAGEIGLDSVINRQLAGDEILFSSGLNQNAFFYKMKLMDKIVPDVIAVGSSRAMQVRSQFFKSSFINLGGAVNSVGGLELFAEQLSNPGRSLPKLAILFLDPWWFNRRYSGDEGSFRAQEFAETISAGLIFESILVMQKGNWLLASIHSNNLGIHAILTGDGFSKDGSYHYTGTISGKERSWDEGFSGNLDRIAHDANVFMKSARADPLLIKRTCKAISSIKKSVEKLVLIAPPFSGVVWSKMEEGGYNYIDDANYELSHCAPGVSFFDYSAPVKIPGSNDCEFVDGFHGGDVTYARILKVIAHLDKQISDHLETGFVDEFIRKNRGYAAGITRTKFLHENEVDFLKIGCPKSSLPL